MKSSEFITESAELRIPTGVRNTTVVNPGNPQFIKSIPAQTTWNPEYAARRVYSDLPAKDYVIKHKPTQYAGAPDVNQLSNVQKKNYQALAAILQRNGLQFDYLGLAEFTAYPAYNASPKMDSATNEPKFPRLQRFVMTAPGFVWEKYEALTQGGGRNTVYVGGQRLKTTSFLSMSPEEQDSLFS